MFFLRFSAFVKSFPKSTYLHKYFREGKAQHPFGAGRHRSVHCAARLKKLQAVAKDGVPEVRSPGSSFQVVELGPSYIMYGSRGHCISRLNRVLLTSSQYCSVFSIAESTNLLQYFFLSRILKACKQQLPKLTVVARDFNTKTFDCENLEARRHGESNRAKIYPRFGTRKILTFPAFAKTPNI